MDEIRRIKRINYLTLGMVAVLVIGCLIGVLLIRERHSYSTEKWLSDPGNRTRIVNDLLVDYALIGMTEPEVLELLGSHDNDSGYFQQEGRLVYWMGPERGLMSIDSEWLILDCPDGIVTAWQITTD